MWCQDCGESCACEPVRERLLGSLCRTCIRILDDFIFWIAGVVVVASSWNAVYAQGCECNWLEAIWNQLDSIRSDVSNSLFLLDPIEGHLDFIETHTDQIAEDTTAIEGYVFTIKGDVENIESDVDAIRLHFVDFLDRFGYDVLSDLQFAISGISAKLTVIDASVQSVVTGVDGLEGLVGSTNSLLSSAGALIAGTNSRLDTTNSRLNSIIATTDGVEGLLSDIVGDLGMGTSNTVHQDFLNVIAAIEAAGAVEALEDILAALDEVEGLLASVVAAVQGVRNDLGYQVAERTLAQDMEDHLLLMDDVIGLLNELTDPEVPPPFDPDPWTPYVMTERDGGVARVVERTDPDDSFGGLWEEGALTRFAAFRDELLDEIDAGGDSPFIFDFVIPSSVVLGFTSPEISMAVDVAPVRDFMESFKPLILGLQLIFALAVIAKEFQK